MKKKMLRQNITVMLVLLTGLSILFLGCTPPTPKAYEPPPKTTWMPDGCRPDTSLEPILGAPTEFFRALHGDTMNSDEVSIALAPVFELDWVVEEQMIFYEAPVFDRNGNIYFCPLWPGEQVILVSINPNDGTRRWAKTGFSNGGGLVVLDDPANPDDQIIYVGTYDQAMAVKPDGTVIWNKPTGLTALTSESDPVETHCYGLNYHVQADALIGVTGDGNIYALDRATGNQLLSSPYTLSGELSPQAAPIALPEDVKQKVNDLVRPLVGGLSPDVEKPYDMILRILLGNETKVANYHAIDTHTGYIWVNATAPDGEDGTVDGISEYGALYRLELNTSGGLPYSISESFHTSFEGGSATSPAALADGSRIYIGDNLGTLIAIDATNGNKIWQIEMGSQIVGSIAVASDNSEIYVATVWDIFKVVDRGAMGEIIWMSNLDMYQLHIGQRSMNMQLTTIGANGLAIQAGAGYQVEDYPLPLKVGVGILDRETGSLRYFSDGIEESLSCINVGPDGAVYIAHSPLRRSLSRVMLGDLTHPITGGIGKYAAKRLDLLIRDAVCAATNRALNASNNEGLCTLGAKNADIKQIENLISQCRRSAPLAIADGNLSSVEWTTIDGYLTTAEGFLATDLDNASQSLQQACEFFPN